MSLARIATILLLVSSSWVASASHVGAQTSDEAAALRRDLEEIRRGQEAIQKELEEIKSLLRSRPPAAAPAEPQEVVLDVRGEPFIGRADAPVTIVEFSDYQCPFCARHVRDVLPALQKDYIATGLVKYVFRNFPIASIHPLAAKAAEAALCAGDQGQYWAMHDRLFAQQNALAPGDLSAHAGALKLDAARFQQCLDAATHAAKVRDDVTTGQRVGVRGTPSFFVALTEPDEGPVTALQVIRGAQPYDAFRSAVETARARTN